MADEAPEEAEPCIPNSCEAPERDERNMEENIINELNNNPDMNCNRSQGKDVLEKCRKKESKEESKWCACKKCIKEEEVHYSKVHDNHTSAMVELQRMIVLAIISWVASTASQDKQSSSELSDDDSTSDDGALVAVETERESWRFSLTAEAADISESEVHLNESLKYSSIEVQPSPSADDMYPTTSYSDFISVEMDSESICLEQSEGDSLGQSEGDCSWEPDSDGPSTAMECHLPAAAVHAEDDSEDPGIVFGSISLDTSLMETEVDEGTSDRSCGASDLVHYRRNHISNYEVETPSSQLAVLMSSQPCSILTMRVFSSGMASSDIFTQLTVMDPSQYHSIGYYLRLESEYLHSTWVIPSLLEALALPSITLAIAVYSVKLALAIFLVSFVVAYCRVVFSCTSSLLFMHRQLQQHALEPPTDVIDELIVSPMDNVHSHVTGRVVRAVHHSSVVSSSHDIQTGIRTATISNHVGGICECEVENPEMIGTVALAVGLVRQKAIVTGSIGLDGLYHVKCTWWRELVQVTRADGRYSAEKRIQVGRICEHFATSMFIEDTNVPVLSQVNELEDSTLVAWPCSHSTIETPLDLLPLQLETMQHFNSPPELELQPKFEIFISQHHDIAPKVEDHHVFAFLHQLEHSGVLHSVTLSEYLSMLQVHAAKSEFQEPLKLFAGPSVPWSLPRANISSSSLEASVSTLQQYPSIEVENFPSLILFQQSSAVGVCVAQSPAIVPSPFAQKSLAKADEISYYWMLLISSNIDFEFHQVFPESLFELAYLEIANSFTSLEQPTDVSVDHNTFDKQMVGFDSAYPLADIKVPQTSWNLELIFNGPAEATVLSLWASLEIWSSCNSVLTVCNVKAILKSLLTCQMHSTYTSSFLLGTRHSMSSTSNRLVTIHFSAMELESWLVIGKVINTFSRLRPSTAHCCGDNFVPQLRPVMLSRQQRNSLQSTTCIPGVTAVVKHFPSRRCDCTHPMRNISDVIPIANHSHLRQKNRFRSSVCTRGIASIVKYLLSRLHDAMLPKNNAPGVKCEKVHLPLRQEVSVRSTNSVARLKPIANQPSCSLVNPSQLRLTSIQTAHWSVSIIKPSKSRQPNSIQPMSSTLSISAVKPEQCNSVKLNPRPVWWGAMSRRHQAVSLLRKEVPKPTSDLPLRCLHSVVSNRVCDEFKGTKGYFSSRGRPSEHLDVGESPISMVTPGKESDSKPTMLNQPLIPSSTSHTLSEEAQPCNQLVNKSIDQQILVKQHGTSRNDPEGADCSNLNEKINRCKQDHQDLTLCQSESPGNERRERLARNGVGSSGDCGESVRKKRYLTNGWTKERNDCHQNLPSSQPDSLENERREKLARSGVGSGHWNSVRKKQALENGGGDEVNHASLRMLSSFRWMVWIFTFFSFIPAACSDHGSGPYPTNTLWDNFLNFLISVLEMLADPTSQAVLAALVLILLVALIIVFVWVQRDCRDGWYRSRSPHEQVQPATSTPLEEVGPQGESTTSSASCPFPCTDNGTKPIQEKNADPVSQSSLILSKSGFLYSEPSAREGNHEYNERDVLIGEGNDDQKNELQYQPSKFVSTKSLQSSCDVSTVGYGNEERSSDSFHDIAITSSQGIASHDASSDTNSNPPSLIATGTALDDLAHDGPRHGIASESAEGASDVSPSGYGWGEDSDRDSEESSASNPWESSVASAAEDPFAAHVDHFIAADVFQDIGEEEEMQNSDFSHVFPESGMYQPSQSEVAGLPALTLLCPLPQSEIAGLPALTPICPLHHNCEDEVEAPLIEGINEVEIVDEVQNVIGVACTSEVTLPCQGDLEARVVNVEPPLEMASLVLADPGDCEDPLPVPVDSVPVVLIDQQPSPCLTDQGYVQPFINQFGQGSEDYCQDSFCLQRP